MQRLVRVLDIPHPTPPLPPPSQKHTPNCEVTRLKQFNDLKQFIDRLLLRTHHLCFGCGLLAHITRMRVTMPPGTLKAQQ